MSRYKVTYKPSGAIAQDIGLTIKMQPLPVEHAAHVLEYQECPECPECPGAPTELVAVWFDENGYPLMTGGGDFGDEYAGDNLGFYNVNAFFATARIINADWETKGIADPLTLDQCQTCWSTEWDGSYAPEYRYAGTTFAVVSNLMQYGDSMLSETGTLTIYPGYDGVSLNPLTLVIYSD